MGDILTRTPPHLTYAHPFVQQAWWAVWAVTTVALTAILGWMGLSFIVQEHLGRHQSGWREMIPRLVLGLTAAASSLWWCALVIDVAHAVSQFIAATLNVTPGDLLRAPLFALLVAVETGEVGIAIFIALLYLVFGFFMLYLLVQMILRLALIDILLCLAPIALGLWILPHTANWGRHWLRLFMTAVFQQAVQLIAVAPDKREAWVADKVKQGIDVLICHPRLVQTGLDLIDFPTIAWYETESLVPQLAQHPRSGWPGSGRRCCSRRWSPRLG